MVKPPLIPKQRSSYKKLICTETALIRYDTCWNARKEKRKKKKEPHRLMPNNDLPKPASRPK